METVILAIHALIALALIVVVLLQRSEGGLGGLGGGGGAGGSLGGVMSSRGAANLLTRATAVLATLFICTSLVLGILGQSDGTAPSILDAPASSVPTAPAEPAAPTR
jgi:preprotein translocase subunit SecG